MPLIFDDFIYQPNGTVAGFRRSRAVPVRTRPYPKIIDLPTHQPKWLAVGNSIGPSNSSNIRILFATNIRIPKKHYSPIKLRPSHRFFKGNEKTYNFNHCTPLRP